MLNHTISSVPGVRRHQALATSRISSGQVYTKRWVGQKYGQFTVGGRGNNYASVSPIKNNQTGVPPLSQPRSHGARPPLQNGLRAIGRKQNIRRSSITVAARMIGNGHMRKKISHDRHLRNIQLSSRPRRRLNQIDAQAQNMKIVRSNHELHRIFCSSAYIVELVDFSTKSSPRLKKAPKKTIHMRGNP